MSIPNSQKLISEIIKAQKELHAIIRAQAANKKILESKTENLKEETIALAVKRDKELNEEVKKIKKNIGNILMKA